MWQSNMEEGKAERAHHIMKLKLTVVAKHVIETSEQGEYTIVVCARFHPFHYSVIWCSSPLRLPTGCLAISCGAQIVAFFWRQKFLLQVIAPWSETGSKRWKPPHYASAGTRTHAASLHYPGLLSALLRMSDAHTFFVLTFGSCGLLMNSNRAVILKYTMLITHRSNYISWNIAAPYVQRCNMHLSQLAQSAKNIPCWKLLRQDIHSDMHGISYSGTAAEKNRRMYLQSLYVSADQAEPMPQNAIWLKTIRYQTSWQILILSDFDAKGHMLAHHRWLPGTFACQRLAAWHNAPSWLFLPPSNPREKACDRYWPCSYCGFLIYQQKGPFKWNLKRQRCSIKQVIQRWLNVQAFYSLVSWVCTIMSQIC